MSKKVEEEISSVAATLFFYYVFYVGIFCYAHGFIILEETNFQVNPPILMQLLKSLLGITLFYSWYYALTIRLHGDDIPVFFTSDVPKLIADIEGLLTSYLGKLSVACYFLTLWPLLVFKLIVEGVISLFLILITLFLYKASLENWFLNSSLAVFLWRRRKIIQFGAGMLCSILFQNFVKLTTMEHISAFLCFAVVWLCSLAMLHPFCDPGILVFLLSNVSLGCTMNIHGMKRETWIVYGVCLLLFWLRSIVHALFLAFTKIMVGIVGY